LPAGKTLEMFIGVDDGAGNLIMPAGVNADYSLFDRMPTFSNESAPANGGSLTSLQVGTGTPAGPPPEQTYFEEVYAVTEDTTLRINPTGGNGVVVISDPSNGEIVEVTVGGVLMYDYTPNLDFSGTDSFIYQRGIGYTYLATLNVSFENDAPVAAGDGPYINAVGTAISIDAAHGVLGNDTDVDGDTLTAVLFIGAGCPDPAGDLTLDPEGSFTYTGAAAATFCYKADDGNLAQSAEVAVSLDYLAPSGLTLVVREPGGTAVPDYRWTVEEDAMWQPTPGVSQAETLATNFHRSYMPVVAQGIGADEFAELALDPSKPYYVSVLPLDAMNDDGATGPGDGFNRTGHTIGGASIMPGATEVTVIVTNEALPYAQISIIVF
jgi:hypothetical protein